MKQIKILVFLMVLAMLFGCGCTKMPASDGNTSSLPETGEAAISVDYAKEELLNKYSSYHEFIECEDEGYQKIVFTTNTTVGDFRFIELGYKEEGENIILFEKAVLYSLDELSPEKPLVVTWMEQGTIPHRGITFVDENNTIRYFCLVMSGMDGSILLNEFQQP